MANPKNAYKEQRLQILNKKISEHEESLPDYIHNFTTFYLSVKRASPNTVIGYIYDIETFFYYLLSSSKKFDSYMDITLDILDQLTPMDIQEYLRFLEIYEKDDKTYRNDAAAAARKLSSLRSLYKYLLRFDMIFHDPTAVIPSPKLENKAIIQLEPAEIKQALNSVYNKTSLTTNQIKFSEQSNYRDIAIISTFLGTGIRISELVGIDMKDINFDNNSIHVFRKGNKDQYVYFNDNVKQALLDYINLERDEEKINQRDQNALFISRKHNRISVRAVERIVEKYVNNAIDGKHITPHKLRSTYGTELYRATGDIHLTADALGHSNVAVTAKHYAEIGNERRKSIPNYTDWI